MHTALAIGSEPFVVEDQNLRILLGQDLSNLILIAGLADDDEPWLRIELAAQDFAEKSGLSGDGDS